MPAVDGLRVATASIPTDAPESDGTLAWDATGVVAVELSAGGVTGLGWSYVDGEAAVAVIRNALAGALDGIDADAVPAAWAAMRRAIRNDGESGIAACAVSALDIALWDRLARARATPLAVALGAFRDTVPLYGSGGFCSYDDQRLAEQLGGWVGAGMSMVKMKVGADPAADPHRVRVAREAIGHETQLFLDANGAWSAREAVRRAHELDHAAGAIAWLEEPVSSRDRSGLSLVRDHVPSHVAVAAGEYVSWPQDARDLLAGGCVDVLQADATRCGGLTGFRAIGALAAAHGVPLSAHCAPSLHLHAACAVERLAHVEHFHDHVRVDHTLLDGVPEPVDGHLRIDASRAGHGMSPRPGALRWEDV